MGKSTVVTSELCLSRCAESSPVFLCPEGVMSELRACLTNALTTVHCSKVLDRILLRKSLPRYSLSFKFQDGMDVARLLLPLSP